MHPSTTPLLDRDTAAIIALERAALDRWGQGDPGGYLELYAPEVTYFDRCSRPGSTASTP